MQIKWEPAYGPAFIAGLVQILVTFFVGGIIWNDLRRDVQAATIAIVELKQANKEGDAYTNKQNERITRAETAIEYIVPSLKRIETLLNGRPLPR